MDRCVSYMGFSFRCCGVIDDDELSIKHLTLHITGPPNGIAGNYTNCASAAPVHVVVRPVAGTTRTPLRILSGSGYFSRHEVEQLFPDLRNCLSNGLQQLGFARLHPLIYLINGWSVFFNPVLALPHLLL